MSRKGGERNSQKRTAEDRQGWTARREREGGDEEIWKVSG